jgi:zinc transport system substrate-binding protein
MWSQPAAASQLSAFVSVAPQRYFLERIGGEHVHISVLVRPGHSPITYEPTPKQMTALADADLYVRIGVPFEDAWMERIASSNPNLMVIDARDGLPLRDMRGGENADEKHVRHVEGKDPHIWLSPPLALKMAAQLFDRLSELDPGHRAEYERNYRHLVADLDQLDRDIRTLLAGLHRRSFIVFHPAWGYFADTYGLQQIPIEVEGKQPGPRSLARLIDNARAQGVKTVFVDGRINHKHVDTIADAIDGRVVTIDPLAEDYLRNLRRVARILASVNQ